MNLLFLTFIAFFRLIKSEESEIGDLYTKYKTRSEVLHVCEGYSGGYKYTFPKIADCPKYKNISKISKSVLVAPFWSDMDKRYPATYCHSHGFKSQHIVNLLNTDVYTSLDMGSFKFSRSDCNKMSKFSISPKGDELIKVGEGQWATQNHKKPQRHYMLVSTVDNINYYVDNIEIKIDSESGLIITGLSTIKPCNYKDGICETVDGMLIWDVPLTPPHCALKKGKSSICLQIEDRITCPDTEFLYTGITSQKFCNSEMPVTMSEQNVIVASHTRNTLSQNSASITDIELYLETGVYTIPEDHRKSRAYRGKAAHVTTDIEEDLKLNYLADKIKNGHDNDIQEISHRVCRNQQETYQMAIYYAEVNQVNSIARLVTKERGFKAELLGDVVRISECLKVDQYHFLPKGKDCIAEYPINYLVGLKEHSGYLRGLTKEIVKTPSYIQCPSPEFYFEISGKVILLGNNTYVQEIPGLNPLPMHYNFTTPNGFDPISMHAKGEHTVDTQFGLDQTKLVAGLGMLDTVIANRINKYPESETTSNLFSAIQDVITAPIQQMITYVIMGCVIFFIVFVLYVIVQAVVPVKTAFFACCGCFTSWFRCCNRLSNKYNRSDDNIELGFNVIKTQPIPINSYDSPMTNSIPTPCSITHCNKL